MFVTGKTVVTSSIHTEMKDGNFEKEILNCLRKYHSKEWGELTIEDKNTNNYAIENGERIVGKYTTTQGDIYIITEADRSYTTILFCHEY